MGVGEIVRERAHVGERKERVGRVREKGGMCESAIRAANRCTDDYPSLPQRGVLWGGQRRKAQEVRLD